MKKCPYCAEEIQDEAIACRYCGRLLEKPKNAFLRWIGIFIYIVVGIYGLLLSWNFLAAQFDLITSIILMLASPFISTIIPWYLLFAHGIFTPLIVIYGGGIIGAIVYNKSGYAEK